MNRKPLTPAEMEQARAVCEQVRQAIQTAAKQGRMFAHAVHKKTKRTVKLRWAEPNAHFPHIRTEGLVKAPDARHIRGSNVFALNFERDYTLMP